ncbi:carboxypeptidase-like regulatory domain-containing protein [Flavobacterium collinsii]|uniref:carboxypeptidase-like regulatory domain-containing protein n=1 Tax=Flavobacterium collinsii TaxID=1114861 RepID=UPI00375691F9
MKRIIIVSGLLFNLTFCFAQIKGRCLDKEGRPIPYASVGLKNTELGTVSDKEGNFVIDSNLLSENNNVIVSCLGYETKSVLASSEENIDIFLKSITYELDEVKIEFAKQKFTKEKKIGSNSLNKHVAVSFSSRNLGAEIGKFFNVSKGRNYKVEKVRFNISEMGYKKARFRINFYSATDAENIDTEKTNLKDIIMEVSDSGDAEVDVSNENLVFTNDFLVSIECLEYSISNLQNDKSKKQSIYFSSNVFCGPIYYRSSKIVKWIPNRGKYNVCLGMQLFTKTLRK